MCVLCVSVCDCLCVLCLFSCVIVWCGVCGVWLYVWLCGCFGVRYRLVVLVVVWCVCACVCVMLVVCPLVCAIVGARLDCV